MFKSEITVGVMDDDENIFWDVSLEWLLLTGGSFGLFVFNYVDRPVGYDDIVVQERSLSAKSVRKLKKWYEAKQAAANTDDEVDSDF
jgi:hypothetical protein